MSQQQELAPLDEARMPAEAGQDRPPMTILEAVLAAARNPEVDADKMERMMALYERLEAKKAKAAYFDALGKMKPELPVIDKRGRIVIHEKGAPKVAANVVQSTPYALWEDIDAAITPILHDHGFVLSFRSGVGAEGKIAVTGVLAHKEGHIEETTITLPHDSSGSKNNVQAVGSSLSYGKRYAATMLLNIRTKGEDDDGNLAGAEDPIDEGQLQHIQDLLASTNSDIELFCQHMKVGALKEILRKDYDAAIIALNTKAKRLQKKQGSR